MFRRRISPLLSLLGSQFLTLDCLMQERNIIKKDFLLNFIIFFSFLFFFFLIRNLLGVQLHEDDNS